MPQLNGDAAVSTESPTANDVARPPTSDRSKSDEQMTPASDNGIDEANTRVLDSGQSMERVARVTQMETLPGDEIAADEGGSILLTCSRNGTYL